MQVPYPDRDTAAMGRHTEPCVQSPVYSTARPSRFSCAILQTSRDHKCPAVAGRHPPHGKRDIESTETGVYHKSIKFIEFTLVN